MNVFDALNEFLDLHYTRGYVFPVMVYVNSRTYSELLTDRVAQSYYHSNPMPHFMVRGVTIQENRGQANEFFSSAMSWNAPSIPNPPSNNHPTVHNPGAQAYVGNKAALQYPSPLPMPVQLGGYWRGGVLDDPGVFTDAKSKSCECGSTAVGSSNHSNWCPVK